MKKKILVQIDHDENASSFDAVVAIDAGVDHLLSYADVTPIEIESLVHGCIFTRGPEDLKHTAIYFGGSDVAKTTELMSQAQKALLGPLSVSMMADPNGSNTTAAAAVLSAEKHLELAGKSVVVLAATGPVGQRVCRLAAIAGAKVSVCSRSLKRAEEACDQIRQQVGGDLIPVEAVSPNHAVQACQSAEVVIAAGAAGVELLDSDWQKTSPDVKLAIDINAVPPLGIAGVEVTDSGCEKNGVICYGAIGVGQLKMKIHKRCIEKLFTANDLLLGAEEAYKIGQEIIG